MFVVYDLEFTSWAGAQERRWTGPGESREIVQIGALRIDPGSLDVDAEFEVLVKPARNPLLSPYFEELTGITNAQVAARGQDFLSAIDAFGKFCNGDYALSYGNDMVIVGENVVLQVPGGQAPGIAMPPFLNIRPWINRRLPETADVAAGGLADAIAGRPPFSTHDALRDCYGILDALRHLRALGEPLFALGA